jgi:hypothetical protein
MSVLQQSQSGGSSKEHEDAGIHFAYIEGLANMSIDSWWFFQSVHIQC